MFVAAITSAAAMIVGFALADALQKRRGVSKGERVTTKIATTDYLSPKIGNRHPVVQASSS